MVEKPETLKQSDKIYHQMVMSALANLVTEAKQIRVSFNPGTPTHRQLSILSSQKAVDPRTIIEVAVDAFFTVAMVGDYE